MKKIIGMLMLMSISTCIFAQDSSKTNNMDMNDSSMMDSTHMKDCIVMKKGQTMVMKNGQTMKLDRVMTLTNGIKVMPDGTLTLANGTTKKLKEGQVIYMDGKMGKMKKMKGMDADSTMNQ